MLDLFSTANALLKSVLTISRHPSPNWVEAVEDTDKNLMFSQFSPGLK